MKRTVLAIGPFVAVLSATAAMQDPTLVTRPPEPFTMRVLVSGLEIAFQFQLVVARLRRRRLVRRDPHVAVVLEPVPAGIRPAAV